MAVAAVATANSSVGPCHHPTEHAITHDVLQQRFLFVAENSCRQIRAIVGTFALAQVVMDLWPVWICRHSLPIRGRIVAIF